MYPDPYLTDCCLTLFGPEIHSHLSTPAYLSVAVATYGAPMITTSCPLNSSFEVTWGTPRKVGSSSAIKGNFRRPAKLLAMKSSQSGYFIEHMLVLLRVLVSWESGQARHPITLEA